MRANAAQCVDLEGRDHVLASDRLVHGLGQGLQLGAHVESVGDLRGGSSYLRLVHRRHHLDGCALRYAVITRFRLWVRLLIVALYTEDVRVFGLRWNPQGNALLAVGKQDFVSSSI